MNSDKATVVAIINSNPDMVRLLRVALEKVGFIVVVLHVHEMKVGAVDMDSFLTTHDPRVVVYDLVPPYEQSWKYLDHLRSSPLFEGRRFVLTTVNEPRVQEIVGPEESIYEIVGGEADIAEVVRAVKEASRARPTR